MGIIAAIRDFLTPLPVWAERGEILMPLFGQAHRLWLIACVCAGLLLTRAHRRLEHSPQAKRRFELGIATAPIVLLCAHMASMLCFSAFYPSCLPLHLCNLCEVLAIAFALTGNGLYGNVLYGVGLAGSASALIFPGWGHAPAFSLPSICGFGEHLLVLAFIVMKLRDKGIRPAFWDIWQPIVFTGIYVCAIYPFNKRHGTNFAFVNWALPDTPLAAWDEIYGNPGYIAVYALAFLLFELMLFLPWRTRGASAGGGSERRWGRARAANAAWQRQPPDRRSGSLHR